MSDRDVVLFLGAGFSHDADLPLLSNFGLKAPLSEFELQNNDGPFEREMAAAARTYESFRDALVDRGALTGDAVQNVEAAFCIAEALKEAGREFVEIRGRRERVVDVVSKIQLWIWKVYHQLPFWNPNRKPRPRTYTDFVELLRRYNLLDKITVVTTNYDIVFEWTVWKDTKIRSSYPLGSSSSQLAKTSPWSDGERFAELQPDPDAGGIRVCKLHGSINYFQASPEADGVLISGDLRTKNKAPAVMYHRALNDIRKARGSRVGPAIVPPGYSKRVDRDWLKEVRGAALDAMSRARAIVFIGYSMPPSDGSLTALFQAAMAVHGRSPRPSVYVVDPCPSVHKRFRSVFGRDIIRTTTPSTLDRSVRHQLPRIFSHISA